MNYLLCIFICYRNWFIFEFVITCGLWVPTVTASVVIQNYTQGFYVVRVIGSLQYLRWMKDLQLIFQVLTSTVYGISLFLVLVLIVFSYFAIAGILLFKYSDPFHFKSFERR